MALRLCADFQIDSTNSISITRPSPLLPTPRPLQRPLPLAHPSLRFLALHLRLEALRYFPLLRDFLAALPHPPRKAREVSSAERGGLEHFRTHHRHAEQVGLELHQQIVGR